VCVCNLYNRRSSWSFTSGTEESSTTSPDGSKRGYTAAFYRDFFGDVFKIMEIHKRDEIN